MRISAADSALSALDAAGHRLAKSAHNLANTQTEDVKPLRTTLSEGKHGGVQARTTQESKPRPVDVARELVDQRLALFQGQAAARVLATDNDLRGRIVDLFA